MRQNKHKTFEFTPRYYDENKERLDNLRRKYQKQEDGNSNPRRTEMLRGDLRQSWQNNRPSKVKSSNRTLLLIIVALLALTYLLIMN